MKYGAQLMIRDDVTSAKMSFSSKMHIRLQLIEFVTQKSH